MISDFRVMGDQREVFGPVASVPAAWRALKEAAAGGDRGRRKVTAAVNRARRRARGQAGTLPPVRIADRFLEGAACIRLDVTVVTAHSGKELAEADFKGSGHHLLLAACDNTGEPLAWMLRPGSAGSDTAADHLRLLREAIEALPPASRRKIMVTCDGGGASHGLVTELDRLASRHGYYKVNQSWLDAAMTACILLAWLKLTALDGDLAKAEPKTLRYRLLHAAARLVRGGRRRTLKIAANWPWTDEIITAWQRIQAIPHPVSGWACRAR